MQTREALKFDLRGKSAFFKKPDANTYAYFTYNNIHKIALLGLLGAVIGLGGYIRQKETSSFGEKQAFPEFYSKLKDLKVCIIPNTKYGYFSKKIQQFNNSVGYASKEEGGNLIVREQWLEGPSWTIYLLKDGGAGEYFERLAENLLNGRCVYIPYLGKNDHPATIENCSAVRLEPAECEYFSCLFPNDMGERGIDTSDGSENGFLFKEYVPYSMSSSLNFYEFKEFAFTNFIFKRSIFTDLTFTDCEKKLVFY
ncbi:CRISPR-associated protein Cas5h [Ruminiclostridium sufflavum DSM 19573]|uniref:CRISPR-associated protein Cas5h n=1 Tax=Ruminiclostridium sufflavum DSM 19573 TaxID=1121337 RepID=A0A318Y4M4_9FIRM|nr:type I-B CRISPR-associated protein Cas5b [Ruminiclostridium sufflavum]PYG86981.1 CRISPR-associated protein Cas5h [Ruminiclostridium sufflavum DSM 19573]